MRQVKGILAVSAEIPLTYFCLFEIMYIICKDINFGRKHYCMIATSRDITWGGRENKGDY